MEMYVKVPSRVNAVADEVVDKESRKGRNRFPTITWCGSVRAPGRVGVPEKKEHGVIDTGGKFLSRPEEFTSHALPTSCMVNRFGTAS